VAHQGRRVSYTWGEAGARVRRLAAGFHALGVRRGDTFALMLESQLKVASPLIGQAYAHGDGRPYNVALIALDPDARAAFDGEIEAEVARGVAAANAKLARVEQIKRWQIVEGD
jgi:long-subunit acyl-CoA synthetase (AMP-forming)